MYKSIKNLTIAVSLISFSVLLSACGFFDKDNTPIPKPLTQFRSEVKPKLLWSTNTGPIPGNEYLKMGPTVGQSSLFTASSNGTVTAISKKNGRLVWRIATGLSLSSSPGVGDDIVVVGSRQGNVVAIKQTDGTFLWRARIKGEILAKPAVGSGVVVVKAQDGYLTAFSSKDGQTLWSYKQIEPNLVLHGASSPIIRGDYLIAGFANGNLTKLNVQEGQLAWQQPLAIPEGAFPIQRMIDIDADPMVSDHTLYAATYRGKIASLDWLTGKVLWTHDISSYTGMTADNSAVFISDSNSYVWSFGADNGLVNWRQTQLEARTLSSPTLMDNYVVVGDAEGYLHWLSKIDGHFAGRVSVGSSIYAAPIVENRILYVLTNAGKLSAYTINQDKPTLLS